MTSVVEACIKHRSKLVFFDNVYAIGVTQVKNKSQGIHLLVQAAKREKFALPLTN